jgi:signal transduction histidine kinase/DNA-binding NarL/FixJ family response regulator
VTRKPETFFEEMKRYVGFSDEDARLLQSLGSRLEPYLPAMSERFYDQITQHPEAGKVFTGGQEQIARLKRTLQGWARRLFLGPFDEDYAAERYRIGVRHVLIGLPQRYMISAMGVVRIHLQECLGEILRPEPARLEATRLALDKILNLDLNMMCESYFQESIRHLRELNRKLERANFELAELSQVKTEFLATTSHELRTPLNSILGFTRLILDGLCENREEERELLRDVLSSAEHLLSIVNDLLDVAKIEAGKLRLVPEPVDLKSVVLEAKAVVSVQVAAKHLMIVDETESSPLSLVTADRARVKQVLINLMSNAVKFTDKGWITLRGRSSPERGFVELELQDTGIGIPPGKQRHLFEKFRQVDSSFTRRQGGSGLGLAICRSLVEMMGGRIKLWSAGVGCGTTVGFSLPVWREADDAVHVAGKEALAAVGDESGVRVLIVDNDPEFRRYLKTLLTKHHYYVLSAATADDALDAARRFRPQVLVVDLALPQRPGAELGDGADLVAQLQTGALVREIYCFMATGYDPAEVRERLALLQVTPEIWQKPVEGEKLLARLAQALRRSAPTSSTEAGASARGTPQALGTKQ